MECNPSVISEDTYVTVTRQKIPALLKRRAHSERAGGSVPERQFCSPLIDDETFDEARHVYCVRFAFEKVPFVCIYIYHGVQYIHGTWRVCLDVYAQV
jgi:hypothetical protein